MNGKYPCRSVYSKTKSTDIKCLTFMLKFDVDTDIIYLDGYI